MPAGTLKVLTDHEVSSANETLLNAVIVKRLRVFSENLQK